MTRTITRDEAREAFSCPVASVNTPFLRDGALDHDGLRRFVDFVIAAGTKCVLLTPGDSLYMLLTDDDVAEVTQTVVRATAGRALVAAAERGWWTGKVVEYARRAREMGVDVLMVAPPDWSGSATPDTLVRHYGAAAEHVPVMLVTASLMTRPMGQALDIIERTVETVPGVVGIKDDICGEFARKLGIRVGGRCAIFAGGLKQNHLNALPYGCDGYMSTFIKFKPSVAQTYWAAILRGDLAEAARITRELDIPFFDFIASFPGGFDAAMHGVLELFGVTGRWRRPPFYSLSDAEMERLSTFFRERGLL